MSTPSQRLSLGPRRVWASITVGLFVLGALEVWVGHLILTRLLGPPVSTVIDVLLIGATVVLSGFVASPLWGAAVRLTGEELVVDLAGLGRARVPLRAIASVNPFQPPLGQPVPPGAMVDGEPPLATFSLGAGDGYVRLMLSEPVQVRHSMWRRARADQLLVRLADPERAAAAISDAVAAPPASAG